MGDFNKFFKDMDDWVESGESANLSNFRFVLIIVLFIAAVIGGAAGLIVIIAKTPPVILLTLLATIFCLGLFYVISGTIKHGKENKDES